LADVYPFLLSEPEGLAAAGLLVAPGDEMALGGALARIMEDGALRNRLRSGALEARTRLPSWNEAVEGIGRALEQVIECG